ncbi:hypothetical protein CARUB_v10002506mg [Capsella rubella]|uniref:Uncharacterized protein n=1 Tax=Capsella rubella TaxID=81985 RepID=R0FIX9_9BRAS|nr:hypothetical protein CARUB_v10002506mg [Capsella rubella]
MVFDRENMKVGWSASKCQENEIEPPRASPGSTSSPYPLTEEQQSRGHAVSPVIAGKLHPNQHHRHHHQDHHAASLLS